MRTVSTDNYNRPLDFCYPWGMDFKFYITLVPQDGLDFSLDGKEITFTIQDESAETGVYFLSQDTSDANITVSGLTITGVIPAADITGAVGIDEGGIYDFGLTIGDPIDGNRIQARFKCLDETGIVASGTNEYSLSLVDFSATVNLAVGAPGPPGSAAPHAISHVEEDSIRDATSLLKGLATAAQITTLEADTTKLATIEDGATADQTDQEIESAYNSQVPQITPTEKNDGTEPGVRRVSPADIKDMVSIHTGSARQDNISATVDPGVNDDSDAGYEIRSLWINQTSNEAFRCHDATPGAAVWIKTTLTADELATVATSGAYDDLSGKPDLSLLATNEALGNHTSKAQHDFNVRKITATTDTATASDCYISIDTSSNNVALTLPEDGNLMLKVRHDFFSSGDNEATITNTVDGVAGPHVIPKGYFFPIVFDGTRWIQEF